MKNRNTVFRITMNLLKGVFGLLIMLMIPISSTQAQCNDLACDSLVLVTLQNAVLGNSNVSWNTANEVSTWEGITVANNRVTEINLTNKNLEGILPPSFEDLTALTKIYFGRNYDLTGVLDVSAMPDLILFNLEFCDMDSLVLNPADSAYMDLTNINIAGTSGKQFVGGSLDISGMPNLKQLTASNVNLSQLIIGDFDYPSLTKFNIGASPFAGTLDITHFPNIEILQAFSCQFSSFISIPGGHTSMRNLTVYSTSFSLTNTLDISGMNNLEVLSALYTDFRYLNVGMGTFPNLKTLRLNNSDFTGTLDISRMPALERADLYYCAFSSLITNPTANYYSVLPELKVYGQGGFGGILDVRGMPNLEILDANATGFTQLMVGAVQYNSLEYLYLFNSTFAGTLDIANMPNLKGLAINDTKLTSLNTGGTTFNSLIDLDCKHARFGGTIDVSSMPVLATLEAENNRFTGLVMTSSLAYFQVENNRLTFEDLVPNQSYLPGLSGNSGDSTKYMPQASVGVYGVYNSNCADSLVLEVEVDVTVPNTTFTWYVKPLSGGSFVPIQEVAGELEVENGGKTLKILDIQTHEGIYQYWITHSTVKGIIKSENKVVQYNAQP